MQCALCRFFQIKHEGHEFAWGHSQEVRELVWVPSVLCAMSLYFLPSRIFIRVCFLGVDFRMKEGKQQALGVGRGLMTSGNCRYGRKGENSRCFQTSRVYKYTWLECNG